MAKTASGKYAYGYCDRTGFRVPLEDLVEEYVQGEPTGLLVCRSMRDRDHPQNWLGRLNITADPQALEYSRPDQGLDESRKLYSWNPVGVGNLEMTGEIGDVSFTTVSATPEIGTVWESDAWADAAWPDDAWADV